MWNSHSQLQPMQLLYVSVSQTHQMEVDRQHTSQCWWDGTHALNLTVTSIYSWAYGDYPFTKNPSDGKPHHFYDETRALFGKTLAAGTKALLSSPPSLLSVLYLPLSSPIVLSFSPSLSVLPSYYPLIS
jgi:hypothetical protein